AGGAFGMVLACDLRIGVETAKFFYPVMKLGFLPQHSDPARLCALVGPARAKMILMAGQKIDASSALQWGLLDELVAPSDLMERALAVGTDAMSADLSHIAAIKSLIGQECADA
ncbi:MAG: enoyl-CoA hydratase/isomerase family protein, partial [Pseudomonadota bacterium]